MDFTVYEVILAVIIVGGLLWLFIMGKTDKMKRYVLELVIIAEENFPEPKEGRNKYYWVTAELKRIFPLFVTIVGRQRLSEWIEEAVSFMKARLRGGLAESIKNKDRLREAQELTEENYIEELKEGLRAELDKEAKE